jgi:mRNA-degrading endonuclease toxin of MazEF toxin-antitoxin module
MSHVEIPKGVGGLTLDSIAKVEQMRAFMVKTRFVEYLGHLPDDYIKKLDRAILITLEPD